MAAWFVRIGNNLTTIVGARDTKTLLDNSARYICIWQDAGVKVYCDKDGFEMDALVRPGFDTTFDNVIVSVSRLTLPQ